VEDELTTTPNIPANWMTDERIYPPQADRRFSVNADFHGGKLTPFSETESSAFPGNPRVSESSLG
jgi:hypothetical protein